MKENGKNQVYETKLPPPWCSGLCLNAMNEVCVEECAIKRDCSHFELKPGITLFDMPRFPATAGMSREEKFTAVTVYLAKIVDHLKGEPNDYYPVRRPRLYRPSGVGIPADIPLETVLYDLSQANSAHPTEPEREDQAIRPLDLAESED